MTTQLRTSMCAVSALLALLIAGCSSSLRTTVDGYNDSMLNGQKVLLLLPDTSHLSMTNPVAYASSRGIVSDGAIEMLGAELRTRLIESLDARLDSNTVLNYGSQAVAGIVPLNTTMFSNGLPASWDKLQQAGREGVFDYLLVLHDFSISNESVTTGRGPETIEVGYSLLDITKQKVMARGTVQAEVDKPTSPASIYQKLAEELSRKLPFWVEPQA